MSLDVLDCQAVACYDNSAVYVLIYHSSLRGPRPLVIVILSVPTVSTYVMIPHYRLDAGIGLHSKVKYKHKYVKPYKYSSDLGFYISPNIGLR